VGTSRSLDWLLPVLHGSGCRPGGEAYCIMVSAGCSRFGVDRDVFAFFPAESKRFRAMASARRLVAAWKIELRAVGRFDIAAPGYGGQHVDSGQDRLSRQQKKLGRTGRLPGHGWIGALT
jgi:hypothetical protein